MVALSDPRTGDCQLDGVPHGPAADPLQRRHRGGARRPILGRASDRRPSRLSAGAQRRIRPGAALSGTVSARTPGITAVPRHPGRCILLRMRNQSEKLPLLDSPESVSSPGVNRRDFIKTTSLAAGALAFGVPTLLRGQNLNSKLNIASIGAMGWQRPERYNACAGENIVALCDVDSGSKGYATQMQKYPDAKFYKDFRQLLDQWATRSMP